MCFSGCSIPASFIPATTLRKRLPLLPETGFIPPEKIVETTRSDDLFDHPLHPYTQALLSAVPVPDPTHARSRIMLEGDVPTPINPPSGCHFHPRCRVCEEICKQEPPGTTDAGDGHTFRCHVAARDFPESATTPVKDPYPHP